MPRPRRDGAPSRPPNKQRLTDAFVRTVVPTTERVLFWDSLAPGLALAVQATGRRSWRFTYRARARVRIVTLGRADVIGLAEARKMARDLLGQVVRGGDPATDRKVARRAETFAEVASQYLVHAKMVNRSWRQARTLVERHLIPNWGTQLARDVTRGDVRAVIRAITEARSPNTANQVIASASAIFSWAIKEEVGQILANPARGIERNETRSRERIVSEAELPRFWAALDDAGLVRSAALKAILLTGQRPGEVAQMRREHIDGGWWTLPGLPDTKLGWPGTKNAHTHRVWLTAPVMALINEIEGTGFVFPSDTTGKRPVGNLDAAMRDICATLGIMPPDKITPHDLRRTHGTTITSLGFGRDAMNRLQNHREGGIGSVYDRHGYAKENQNVQQAVTRRIMAIISRETKGNVVELQG